MDKTKELDARDKIVGVHMAEMDKQLGEMVTWKIKESGWWLISLRAGLHAEESRDHSLKGYH